MCACKLQIVDDGFGPLKKETSINNLLESGPNLIFKGLKGVSLHKTSNRSTTPSIRSIWFGNISFFSETSRLIFNF